GIPGLQVAGGALEGHVATVGADQRTVGPVVGRAPGAVGAGQHGPAGLPILDVHLRDVRGNPADEVAGKAGEGRVPAVGTQGPIAGHAVRLVPGAVRADACRYARLQIPDKNVPHVVGVSGDQAVGRTVEGDIAAVEGDRPELAALPLPARHGRQTPEVR